MKFHFLFHVPFEGPGSMESWITQKGHAFSSTPLWDRGILPDAGDFDSLIIMGGPMNIYEEKEYPWLKEEKKLIEKSIGAGKHVMGVCLGAQLIADVLGAKVYKNPQKEIGWLPIEWTKESGAVPNFPDFSGPMTVFQWHGDTFPLPQGAIRLAGSKACENQAFLYNDRVLGLQFHLESTPESVRLLVENCRKELVPAPFIQTEKEILSNQAHYGNIHAAMEKIMTAAAGGYAGPVSPLQFPLDCQFRVIAENLNNMHFVIETVLMQMGVSAPLKTQNQSGGGKYLSFSVDTRVESLEQMNLIDAALRSIAGVKMVL